MYDVLPPRNLGIAENWGRVAELRMRSLLRAGGSVEQDREGAARASSATLAGIARQADRLESALRAVPLIQVGGDTASGFAIPAGWSAHGTATLVAPSGKSYAQIVTIGNGFIWHESGSIIVPGFIWPFDLSTVSSEYGPRSGGTGTFHEGIDFAPGAGSMIYAAGDGTVDISGWHSAFGNYVILDHGVRGAFRLKTLYAHMDASPLVSVGNSVTRGTTVLGYVGNTGVSFGAHLHWETHMMEPDGSIVWNTSDDGGFRTAVNPRYFMDTYGDGSVTPVPQPPVTARINIGGDTSREFSPSRSKGSQFYLNHGASFSVAPGQSIPISVEFYTTGDGISANEKTRSSISVIGVFS